MLDGIEVQPLLFAGTSHLGWSQCVAKELGTRLGDIAIETFPDGEIGVQIKENVRSRDVFVLQTIARRPHFYLMELLIIIDALKRASAKSITAVIPYFGYARQDRKDKGRVPITAKLVANLLEKAGATRVLTMDLHAEQLQGFFDIPVDNLYARPVLARAAKDLGLQRMLVVTPDIGSIRLARAYASSLHTDLAIVDKRRVHAGHVEAHTVIGDVSGRDVLLVDDICSTGNTLRAAAQVCKKAGARRVSAVVTHGLFVGPCFGQDEIEEILVSDTISQIEAPLACHQVRTISVAPLFAQAIDAIVSAKSISSLFDGS